MKGAEKKRSYVMTARADKAAKTESDIMRATVELWQELSLREITLDKVAQKAGVTVRTVLRKYGSKDALFEACLESDAPNYLLVRENTINEDLKKNIRQLMLEYEGMGDAVMRTIAVENELPFAKKMLERGRRHHREWCAQVFDAYLPTRGGATYEMQLTSYITATEIYLWKLLRRDLNKSFEDTYRVFLNMVEGLIEKFKTAKTNNDEK